MRKRNMILTILVTVVILCVGVFLPGWLDKMLFDADTVAEEEWSVEAQLEEDREQFMEHFFFPLFERSEPMSPEEQLYFQVDSDGISGEIYERLSEAANVLFEDIVWEAPAFVGNRRYVIVQNEAPENKEGYRLHLAMADATPVLFWRENLIFPTEEQQQAAREKLQQYASGSGQELSDYIGKIDEIYGDTLEYRQNLNEIYERFHSGAGEISGKISLWACCEKGEWQVYTSKTQNILACVLGERSLILYYDAVGEQFCGYSIVPLGAIP